MIRTKARKRAALFALGMVGLLVLALLVPPRKDPAFQLGYAGLSQFDSNSVLITLTNRSASFAKFHVFTETSEPLSKKRFVADGDAFASNTYAFHVAWPSTNEWRLSGYYFVGRSGAWRRPVATSFGRIGLKRIQGRLMCPEPKRIDMIGLEMVGAYPNPDGSRR